MLKRSHRGMYAFRATYKGKAYCVAVPMTVYTYQPGTEAEEAGNPILAVGIVKDGSGKWLAYELNTGLLITTAWKRKDLINKLTEPGNAILPKVCSYLRTEKGNELMLEFDAMLKAGPRYTYEQFKEQIIEGQL